MTVPTSVLEEKKPKGGGARRQIAEPFISAGSMSCALFCFVMLAWYLIVQCAASCTPG